MKSHQRWVVITIAENEVSLDEEEGADEPREFALVIDGKALSQYLPSSGAYNELSARFLELAMRCKAVICCRVSPLQKVHSHSWWVKECTGLICLGCAVVGGESGKEGAEGHYALHRRRSQRRAHDPGGQRRYVITTRPQACKPKAKTVFPHRWARATRML